MIGNRPATGAGQLGALIVVVVAVQHELGARARQHRRQRGRGPSGFVARRACAAPAGGEPARRASCPRAPAPPAAPPGAPAARRRSGPTRRDRRSAPSSTRRRTRFVAHLGVGVVGALARAGPEVAGHVRREQPLERARRHHLLDVSVVVPRNHADRSPARGRSASSQASAARHSPGSDTFDRSPVSARWSGACARMSRRSASSSCILCLRVAVDDQVQRADRALVDEVRRPGARERPAEVRIGHVREQERRARAQGAAWGGSATIWMSAMTPKWSDMNTRSARRGLARLVEHDARAVDAAAAIAPTGVAKM